MKPATCHKCNSSEHVLLRRLVAANGNDLFAWYCPPCRTWAEKPIRWLPHDAVVNALAKQGHAPEDIPTIGDYRASECVICGNKAAEYNHWMPQMHADDPAIAPEWAAWSQQGAPLCKYHHDLWHRIVTPYMPGRRGMVRNAVHSS